jgi:hypothetical protein
MFPVFRQSTGLHEEFGVIVGWHKQRARFSENSKPYPGPGTPGVFFAKQADLPAYKTGCESIPCIEPQYAEPPEQTVQVIVDITDIRSVPEHGFEETVAETKAPVLAVDQQGVRLYQASVKIDQFMHLFAVVPKILDLRKVAIGEAAGRWPLSR